MAIEPLSLPGSPNAIQKKINELIAANDAEVFWYVRGTTSYAELQAAFSAKKVICCYYSSYNYICLYLSGSSYYFWNDVSNRSFCNTIYNLTYDWKFCFW